MSARFLSFFCEKNLHGFFSFFLSLLFDLIGSKKILRKMLVTFLEEEKSSDEVTKVVVNEVELRKKSPTIHNYTKILY